MEITGASYNTTDLLLSYQQLNANSDSGKNTASASTALSSLFDGASMSSQLSSLVELTKYAMDAMGISADGRVTFSQIGKYREQLQETFNKNVSDGLVKAGIENPESLKFTITDEGAIMVVGDHPDSRKIQQFFDDNPELIKTFQQIEALASIDEARKKMQVAPHEMKKRLQIENMTAWWANSGEASSYFGSYSDGGLSLLSGINVTV
ncbi:MAG: hypothetical protein LBB60_06660 [Desulfovibrio sp.]|jgi:hypothetical protein|nr:hypothetical protein [Desulfovibrio sp.]